MSLRISLALCAAIVLSIATSASAQRGKKKVSRFQQPANERALEVEDEPNRERIETSLYFAERPDSLGGKTREYRDAKIAKLLTEREAWVVERREQAIRLLEQFIRAEPEKAPEMPDALLRLAELRWEGLRRSYLQAFAAWQKKPEATRGPEPKPNYRRPMELYDRILTKHPKFDRLDFTMYMKAYAFLELGNTEGALGLYRQILKKFPNSRFVPDAHFALAESAFNGRSDYTFALSEYEKVMKYKKSELYDISLFKSAWCLWRMNRTQDAALRFRKVLDLGGDESMSADQRRRLRDLQNEALDYLIQVFVEDEKNAASDVFDFLDEIGGEQYASRVLKRLSETYMGQARYERAVEAYRLLIELDPSAKEAARYQREIAGAYSSMGSEEKTQKAYLLLAKNYSKKSKWAKQQGDPSVVEDAIKKNERVIRKQALKYHQRGQKENQKDQLENAVSLYKTYLKYFGERKQAYELQFYLAEILFHRLERFPEAGEAYLDAAQRKHDGEYTRDALYNAIGAFERVRETQIEACSKQGKKPTEGEVSACDGETDNDRKFAEAIGLYVELFPNDPDLPEILFRQGRLYYDRGIYDPAVQLFGNLLERFPNSDYAEPAGELILDSFNKAKDYQNIEKWARRLKEAPSFRADKSQRRLDGLILQSMFKSGEQLAAKDKHVEAADAYYRAAEEFPQDPRAPQAYYNAGFERQKAGDLSGAAKAYDRLIKKYPGKKEGALGAWNAAQMYESIAQFSDAARYYEAYEKSFSRAPKTEDALYNAVLLRVTAGDFDEAVLDGRKFVKRFPRSEPAADVYFFIGRAQEGKEDWRDAARTYRDYIKRARNLDRKVEAQTRLAQVLVKAGDQRAADKALAGAVKLGKKNKSRLSDGLSFAAEARYIQGDQVLARYEAISIAGDSAGLRSRLEKKSNLLRDAALIYADVVSFNVAEWVTASLFQIGRSYELFAEAMREFEVPPNLSEDEEQSYRDQLAMFIVPMEERALEAFEGGYQKAIELRIFNAWTAKLRKALTRLNDVQYPPLREVGANTVTTPPLAAPMPLAGLSRQVDEAAADEEDDEKEAKK